MDIISPQRDLITSAINTITAITDGVEVFDSNSSDSTEYPQIAISTGNPGDAQRAKNEQRGNYTVYADYYDVINNDHGVMMDTLFSIREYLKYLRLSNYNCTSYAYNQSAETTDTSTSQPLRHVTITIDYQITEKSFI